MPVARCRACKICVARMYGKKQCWCGVPINSVPAAAVVPTYLWLAHTGAIEEPNYCGRRSRVQVRRHKLDVRKHDIVSCSRHAFSEHADPNGGGQDACFYYTAIRKTLRLARDATSVINPFATVKRVTVFFKIVCRLDASECKPERVG